MVILNAKNIEKRFFHCSLRSCVKHNHECELCHLNCYCYIKPYNKYDGSYSADNKYSAKKLHLRIFILILEVEKIKN